LGEEAPDGIDDKADMGLVLELMRLQPPDAGEGRIAELEPAVAAEHGDAFIEMVEGFALNLDQGVVGALEPQRVRHILIADGDAAERMGGGHHAQGRAVRQMQQLLHRMQQGEQLAHQLALVFREVGIFGDAAALAQRLQHLVQRRLAGEEFLLQAELLGVFAVVEAQLAVGVEDGDGGRQAFQYVGMGAHMAFQLALCLVDRGLVGGVADDAAADQRHLRHRHEAPVAAQDYMLVVALRLVFLQRLPRHVAAAGAAHQLDALLHHLRPHGLDAVGIGLVAVFEG
jgi:hypothetical protein